ncbi:primosomal protein N' [Psychrobium sp. 1_MG-2023]|uniref:primosomal protein N' n=1 Tax=Psychrobium sp. 1_MG-2023 TaxID=3062624 RepID=UPI000C31EDC3|nr:primosomal protein N' [Psychrobium sp. 1_MG-2023]MDP2562514.1 primosomal protein N' [Psychrobium sp. 1_MG-2023]PKF57994.1 primosomal protein N' [Alteromonadales bacterium alter-6D02]
MTHTTLVEVAVPTPLRRKFSYLCPSEFALPSVGARVEVPFGSRTLIAMVTGLLEESEVNRDKLKALTQVLDDDSLQPITIHKLLGWASNYYLYSLGEIYHQSMPALLRKGEAATIAPILQWQLTEQGQSTEPDSLARAKKQQQLVSLLHQGPHTPAQLKQQDISSATIKAVEKKALIEQVAKPLAAPCSWTDEQINHDDRLVLNKEQAIAVAAINIERGYSSSLLLGITGSGKTEVYLQAIEQVINAGKQALIIVPEIGLTPQTLHRFQSRFNVPIVFLHSGLNDKERLDGWLKAQQGQAALIIGTRSAIFTPLKRPGMIIVDEEHDSSLKQQDTFRYNARDLAVVRANIEQIPLVLGSATPCFETLHNAKLGKYQQLTLSKRAANASEASHQIIDIKGVQLQSGLSPQLIQLMEHHLSRGNQVMLFLNRRGYAPALLCHECGWLGDCHRCDAHYTVHQRYRYIQCHHCGDQHGIPTQCPGCGSTQLVTAGVGTEQLEQTVNELFPQYKSVRIDRDSTRRKGSLDESLEGINNNDYQVLIGTQMLAKGHHFPDVTLVALLDVDGALFSGDFRASEKLAQLYLQVSGRAGRASKPGQVALQTHHPEHQLLQRLNSEGYSSFSEDALTERKIAQLPPYWHMALLRIESHNPQHITVFNQVLQDIAQLILQQLVSKESPLRQIGPMPSPMERRAGKFRWQVIFEASKRSQLHKFLTVLIGELDKHKASRLVRWSIDVDPIDMV